MNKQLIILSVPHELCLNKSNQDHLCDSGANNFSQILESILKSPNREISVFHGNINRSYIDLNRIASRLTTEFRWDIREQIFNKIKYLILNKIPIEDSKIIYLFDCHSYPPVDNHYANYEMVILLDNYKYLKPIQILQHNLIVNNIDCKIIRGITNDIIDEAYLIEKTYNLNNLLIFLIPMLIEINENLDNNKLIIICKIINQWIIAFNNYLVDNLKNKFIP